MQRYKMPVFSANIVTLTLESEPRKCFAFISRFLYHDFRSTKNMLHLKDSKWYPKLTGGVYDSFSRVSEGFRGDKRDSFDPGKDSRFRPIRQRIL
jgi:hypothetical protein